MTDQCSPVRESIEIIDTAIAALKCQRDALAATLPAHTVQDVAAMQDTDTWLTATQIGQRFGINPNTVCKTAKRKRFRRHPDNDRLICLADATRKWVSPET